MPRLLLYPVQTRLQTRQSRYRIPLRLPSAPWHFPFPPVRFVPEAPLRSTALAVKFSDLWMLLLRVLAIFYVLLGLTVIISLPEARE